MAVGSNLTRPRGFPKMHSELKQCKRIPKIETGEKRRSIAIIAVLVNTLLLTFARAAVGDLNWSFTIPGGTDSSPAVNGNGVVYLGGNNGKVYKFDPATASGGTITPTVVYDTYSVSGHGGQIHSSLVLNKDGSKAYFGCDDGYLYCLTLSGTPSLAWAFPIPPIGGITQKVRSTPALDSLTESVLYFAADNGLLYSIDVSSGSQRWSFNAGAGTSSDAHLASSPVIGSDGTIFIIGLNAMFALEDKLTSAAVKWTKAMPDSDTPCSPAIGPDGSLYFAVNWKVCAVNPLTGEERWARSLSGITERVTGTVVVDQVGNLFLGTSLKNLYSLSGIDGSDLATSVPIAGAVFGAGLITADGKSWFVGNNGRLYSLSSAGALVGNYPLGSGGASFSGGAVGPVSGGYAIYVVNGDNKLYSVVGPNQPLAAAGWPNWRLNNRHVGDMRNNRWTEGNISSVSIIEIGPFASGTFSYGYAINDKNTVVGQADGYYNYPQNPSYYALRGYKYDSGITETGCLGYLTQYSLNYGINNDGWITGWSQTYPSGNWHAFRRSPSGTLSDLTCDPGYTSSYGLAISSDSTIYGYMGASGIKRATRWDAGSTTPIDLGVFEAGSQSQVLGVTTQGRMVGTMTVGGKWHGFVSDSSLGMNNATDLVPYYGTSGSSTANAIDGTGQIVGDTQIDSVNVRPAYKKLIVVGSQGQSQTVVYSDWIFPSSMPTAMNGNSGTVLSANDRNQFVGQAKNSSGSYRAFIWIPGQLNLKNLNDYLSATQASTWTLNAAYGISDAGRIVLWATKLVGGTSYQRAVILYPN